MNRDCFSSHRTPHTLHLISQAVCTSIQSAYRHDFSFIETVSKILRSKYKICWQISIGICAYFLCTKYILTLSGLWISARDARGGCLECPYTLYLLSHSVCIYSLKGTTMKPQTISDQTLRHMVNKSATTTKTARTISQSQQTPKHLQTLWQTTNIIPCLWTLEYPVKELNKENLLGVQGKWVSSLQYI